MKIEINNNLPLYVINLYSHNKHIATYKGLTSNLLFGTTIDDFSKSEITKVSMSKTTYEYLTQSNPPTIVTLILSDLQHHFKIKLPTKDHNNEAI